MRRLIATGWKAGDQSRALIRGRFCAVFAVFLMASGCHRALQTTNDIAVDASLDPRPARVGPATVTVALRDAAAKPVRGAQVTAEANMLHPGMSPLFREAGEVAPGRYQANLELGMRGDWVILLHIRLADGKKLERQLAVEAK